MTPNGGCPRSTPPAITSRIEAPQLALMHNAFMSSVPIKICGLTREQDVDACVEQGVHAVGFVLYAPSPRAVSPERAAALACRLPAWITPVLLFVNPSANEVALATQLVPGAVLQFHGDESAQTCQAMAHSAQRRWVKAIRFPELPSAEHPAPDLLKCAQDYQQASALLLDTWAQGFGGSGKRFNWSQLPPSVNAHLVLSGGLDPANVGEGVRALRTRGLSLSVDVSSGVESAKGIKDPVKIRDFVMAVRTA